MIVYRIKCKSPGEPAYWNAKEGWVSADKAYLYRGEHAKKNTLLPEGGEWEVLVEIHPASPDRQREAASYYLVKKAGHRPSEAAMHVASMKEKKLRRFYQDLIITGKITQHATEPSV